MNPLFNSCIYYLKWLKPLNLFFSFLFSTVERVSIQQEEIAEPPAEFEWDPNAQDAEY